ncbi:MAG: tetratricopeptide repeat protein [Elainellaceae cyanobacterium]
MYKHWFQLLRVTIIILLVQFQAQLLLINKVFAQEKNSNLENPHAGIGIPTSSLTGEGLRIRLDESLIESTDYIDASILQEIRFPESLETLQQALETYQENSDRPNEANTLQLIGELYIRHGQLVKSLESFEQALEIYRELGDRIGEGNTLRLIGSIFSSPLIARGANRIQLSEALSNLQILRDELGDEELIVLIDANFENLFSIDETTSFLIEGGSISLNLQDGIRAYLRSFHNSGVGIFDGISRIISENVIADIEASNIVEAGNITLESGSIIVSVDRNGNIDAVEGNIELEGGNVRVNGIDIGLEGGNIELESANIRPSGNNGIVLEGAVIASLMGEGDIIRLEGNNFTIEGSHIAQSESSDGNPIDSEADQPNLRSRIGESNPSVWQLTVPVPPPCFNREDCDEQTVDENSNDSITIPVQRMIDLYASAINLKQRALQIFEQTNNLLGQGITLSEIGFIYENLGYYSQALEVYQRAFNIFRTAGESIRQGAMLNNLGEIQRKTGQYSNALSSFGTSLQLFQENPELKSTTLNNIGLVHQSLGQFDLAQSFYQQALQIREEVGDLSGQSTTLHRADSL